ncbi:MAG: hypothetical protein EBZ40_11770 [Gammaproteobacteria bacterium]|nr:hypothetical protein [Gammaproteobacteria bacterium]
MAVRNWRLAKASSRIERIETREKVPTELVDLISALDDQIAQLRAEVKRMKPVVDAVVDHAKRSTG